MEFNRKKESGTLLSQQVRRKIGIHSASVDCTSLYPDGLVRFGDIVMIKNSDSDGLLSVDLDEFTGNGQLRKYTAVTTTVADAPCKRNTWFILRIDSENDDFYRQNGEEDIVHYGQKFKLMLNPDLAPSGAPLFLQTEMVSATLFSKVSKKQEVSLKEQGTFEFAWMCLFPDVEYRMEMEGQPVKCNSTLLLQHCQSNQPLSSEASKRVITDFGSEFEVCCHKWPALQTRLAKSVGGEKPCNHWAFMYAPAPS